MAPSKPPLTSACPHLSLFHFGSPALRHFASALQGLPWLGSPVPSPKSVLSSNPLQPSVPPTVHQTHQPRSVSGPLHVLVGGSVPSYLHDLLLYFVCFCFKGHPMYSSLHPPSLSNSLSWIYFSLSTSYSPNIVCAFVSLFVFPHSRASAPPREGTCRFCSPLYRQHLELSGPH